MIEVSSKGTSISLTVNVDDRSTTKTVEIRLHELSQLIKEICLAEAALNEALDADLSHTDYKLTQALDMRYQAHVQLAAAEARSISDFLKGAISATELGFPEFDDD